MAVSYFPFNSIVTGGVPDRPANAESLAAYLAAFFSNGVLMQSETALQIEASSGMDIQIHAGVGCINGKTILNDAAEVITLEAASLAQDRIDRIIFRLDEVNRIMEFAVLTGTPAAAPVAPELARGADVYEMCLAEISIPAGASEILSSYITDTRSDNDLCGLASIAPHMQDLEHGGTGVSVETEAELLAVLGACQIDLLWTNASLSSNFAAQTVSLNLSEYDGICVEVAAWKNWQGRQMSPYIPKNDNSLVVCPGNVTSCRYMKPTDTGVAFATATATVAYNALPNTSTDEYCIPFRIYGIKNVN